MLVVPEVVAEGRKSSHRGNECETNLLLVTERF